MMNSGIYCDRFPTLFDSDLAEYEYMQEQNGSQSEESEDPHED